MQERVGSTAWGDGAPATAQPVRRLVEALQGAPDVAEIAARAIDHLRHEYDAGVVMFALAEGGGRRLRMLTSDRLARGDRGWFHVDAYDDVPLTFVTRTGDAVLANLADLAGRFTGLLADRAHAAPEADADLERVAALAALPMPGTGSPIGGLLLYFDAPQTFDDQRVRELEDIAAAVSRAVRRLRLTVGRQGADAVPAEPEVPAGALTAAVLLESDPRASGAARRFLRQHAAVWGIDGDSVDTAQLCLSEVVTNAVVHAGTASELRLILEGDLLTVFVRDLGGLGGSRGAEPQAAEDLDPLRVFGRGLMLVDALAERWGSERDVTGTTVWFALTTERS